MLILKKQMKIFLFIFINLFFFQTICQAQIIDVIIPCTCKDLPTLELAILGIRENCQQIGRIIVVSDQRYTDLAEWFDESLYPFSKKQIAYELWKQNQELADYHMNHGGTKWVGWYYQQLLKFYAPFVIPSISSNILILDADTVFLNSVEFLDSESHGLYNISGEWHQAYYDHANRLIPGLTRSEGSHSGVCHHMLFQKSVLEEIFSNVEKIHGQAFWQAFCKCVDLNWIYSAGASEYEIYFHYGLRNTNQIVIRPLLWCNASDLKEMENLKKSGYHYGSFHEHMRK